jgi:hypothetical protein
MRLLSILTILQLLVRPAAAQPAEAKNEDNKAADANKAAEDKAAEERKAADAAASLSFKEGQKLFESADYLGAIEAFEKAQRLRPHFSVLCNIALCHERRNDMIEAARYYRRCRDEGAGKSGQAAAVANSLKRVEARITWFKVTSDAGGTIYVDGKQGPPAPARIPVNPGSHVVEVRREGARPVSTTVKTRGGEQRELDLSPVITDGKTDHPKRRRVHHAYFWSAAGVTLALALAATITGIQTLGIHDDYEVNPTRDLLERGEDRRAITNLLWAGAAICAASTTTLFFFTDFPWHHREQRVDDDVVLMGVGIQGVF